MSSDLVNIIFGMKVRQARMEAGMSLTDFAKAADLSASYLTEIEKGRKYPRTDKILRMAEVLDKEYDHLVSIKLGPSLTYLETALASPLMREFPFEEFGLDVGDLVSMLTRAPAKASALLHAALEIGRQYDMKEEHFFRAMLRSYQEIHDNYFPELEEKAEAFAAEFGLESGQPVELAQLRSLIQEQFNYELEDEYLAADENLDSYRSVYVPRRQPLLFINSRLRPMQIKFLLAREMGYQYLGLTERSHMSTPDRVDSFHQVFNDFQTSYFAGALLMPRSSILAAIEELFGHEKWQPELLLNMLDRYDVTPEMLFYRFSEIIPQFFGLKLHFLRLHGNGRGYRLMKRLNMNQLPVPSGLALYEHYCRRWLTSRLLSEVAAPENGQAQSGRPLVGVQLSEFLDTHDRFLCIGFARPLVLSPNVFSSTVVGFRVEPDIAETIRFFHDSEIPSVIINETCERCPLTSEQCQVRVADPVIVREIEYRRRRRQAVDNLMAQYQG